MKRCAAATTSARRRAPWGRTARTGDGGCFCAGLTVRGRHLLVFDEVQRARALRRRLMEEVQQPPALAFARLGTPFKTPSLDGPGGATAAERETRDADVELRPSAQRPVVITPGPRG